MSLLFITFLWGKLKIKFIWLIYFLIIEFDESKFDIDNNGLIKKLILVKNIIILSLVSLFLIIKKVEVKIIMFDMLFMKMLLNKWKWKY